MPNHGAVVENMGMYVETLLKEVNCLSGHEFVVTKDRTKYRTAL